MKKTLKILCLEDDQEDFEIINHILEKGGLSIAPIRVDTKEKYLDALTTYHPDVILSDHSLPKFNSTEALKLCQAKHLQIPFILVTGAVSDEFAVNCMKLGADDYVLKSNLNRLPNAIENALKHKRSEIARLKAISELAGRNEELLKINNELDSFVYSVSHNLRAPLMSVLGLLNLVKSESDTHNLDQYHHMMEESIHKLDNTVKEILDYSRNARQEIQVGPIDLRNLIKETLDKMQFMPGFELLDIQLLVDDHEFYSDFYRVSVILNNVISNAIKYLDQSKSKPSLVVTVTIDDKKTKLSFQDNGIGIDKVVLPKVFDMFFRATNKNEGSGLGLYIVKEASEKLHGKIEIESTVGTGTLITVEIPNHVHLSKVKKPASTAVSS